MMVAHESNGGSCMIGPPVVPRADPMRTLGRAPCGPSVGPPSRDPAGLHANPQPGPYAIQPFASAMLIRSWSWRGGEKR